MPSVKPISRLIVARPGSFELGQPAPLACVLAAAGTSAKRVTKRRGGEAPVRNGALELAPDEYKSKLRRFGAGYGARCIYYDRTGASLSCILNI